MGRGNTEGIRRAPLVGAALCVLLMAANARSTEPPLGTDTMRRDAINQPRNLIAEIRTQLDASKGALPSDQERGLLWWMGSAALNINDDAALTESVLRLDSLGSSHNDPLASAAAGFLRAFHDIENGDEKGIAEALQAAEIVQGDKDPRVVAWSQYQLCDAYTQLGHAARGLPLCRDAEQTARKVGDVWEISDDQNDEAWNLSALNQWPQAVTLYQEARRGFASIDEPQIVAMDGDNLAHTYLQLGRPKDALALSKASLAGEISAGLNSDVLLSQANIARAYAALGQTLTAQRLIKATIADAKRTENTDLLPDLLDTESHFEESAGKLKEALLSARQVNDLLRDRHKPGLLSNETTLEKRYETRERDLRISELEHENTIKDLALKAANAEAARVAEEHRREKLGTLIVFVVAAALLIVTGLLYLLLRLQRRHTLELSHQALRDPLTGINNRRAFMLEAHRLIADAKLRPAIHHTLILIDFDHFKHINDTAGHPMGDRVLAMVVTHMQRICSDGATIARLGGEEFAVLCASADRESGRHLAETLRLYVAKIPLPPESQIPHITISVGVAVFDGDVCHDIDSWMHAADQALYAAKSGGRNRVVIYPATADNDPSIAIDATCA